MSEQMSETDFKISETQKAFGLVPETKVTEVSFVYETEPWGYDQQDNF